jgi:hypothetical protein
LIKLFQKFAQVEGAQPSSPPQRRNFHIAVFWFFFAATPSKKNGENLFNVKNERAVGMLCEKIVSVLFEQRGPKRTKKAV